MLENRTPFAAERCWVRDKCGAEVWLVAIKATFDIDSQGSLRLAQDQEPVHIAPVYRDDSVQSSLLYDSDLPHLKRNTDVLVDGHAYAPRGLQTTRVDVRLMVANIDKTLSVMGDRYWVKSPGGLSMTKPQPFVKLPLIYERAFGGMDQTSEDAKHHGWEPRNPVGRGFATRPDHLTGKTVPNIEHPSMMISDWKQRPTPAGFAPIPGHWSPRVELAGTYDENWESTRQPLLPVDFDEEFYQCAPRDQQANGHLKGGEVVDLRNMTPNGFVRFRLPRLSFAAESTFEDGAREFHRPCLHTVAIRPDFPRVVLVWHLYHECHHKVLQLRATKIRIKERIKQADARNSDNAWSMLNE